MQALSKHGPRIAVTLLPLIFAILHAVGFLHLGVLQRLDHIIYDARLRATMPGTLDERVVIVDTSNEIGGDGDIPHSGIGRARRMQV